MAWSQFIALLQSKPRSAIALLVTCSLAALFFVGWYARNAWAPAKPPERVAMVYYFDQNSQALLEVPAGLKNPLPLPGGEFCGMPAGVRAKVFSCGRCNDEAQRFVGWLEAPSAVIEAAGLSLPPRPESFDAELADSVLVIRTPDDEHWQYFESNTGQQIIQQVQQRCAGGGLRFCEPPRRLVREVDPKLLRLAQQSLAGEE